MKNLAPDITRQRLMLEGFYTVEVNPAVIEDYFNAVTKALNLRMYGKPIIFSPSGEGRDDNQGYDAFVPLIDSGISAYFWSKKKFFSGIIYTCKAFDETIAAQTTKEFFGIKEVETFSF
jgi:S-adenosylmethionine decarboxylase